MNVVIGPLHPPISTYKPTPIKYAKKDAQSNELQYKATKSYSVRVKKKKKKKLVPLCQDAPSRM